MTREPRITGRQRAGAIGVTTGLSATAAVTATVIGPWAGRAILSDLGDSPMPPSAVLLHLLLAVFALTLVWASLVAAASAISLVTVRAPDELHSGPGNRAGLHHRLAAVVLALTGAGGLAAIPTSGSATAAAPPTAVVQPVPTPANAMAIPLPAGPAPVAEPPTADADVPRPGWVTPPPSPTSQRSQTGARLIAGPVTADDLQEVVVHRGDSLWSLVSRHLHTGDACVISAVWPRWYAANSAVIGADPDLLHVGQRLRIPPIDGDHHDHCHHAADIRSAAGTTQGER